VTPAGRAPGRFGPRAHACVTVAIPTRNAGDAFATTLRAVRRQEIGDMQLELLICDSGSVDGTVDLARRFGAEVIEIRPDQFAHGPTRNLMMERARGEYVAFLTQDAIPADSRWLAQLVDGFALASDVGLTFGPYVAHPTASPYVKRELSSWFGSFTEPDQPRIDTLPERERSAPPHRFLGHLGFFTDANGCLAREAWAAVPFRNVGYAEDHLLAQDMLRAGFAKVFLPGAAVIHSHDYTLVQWVRRSYDEGRAVREVYGWAGPAGLRARVRELRGHVGADLRWIQAHPAGARRGGVARSHELASLSESVLHHAARSMGTWLGQRSDRLPRSVRRRLSLERRP
jgi:glycosyltransferase involved in cell wall biosynthesis